MHNFDMNKSFVREYISPIRENVGDKLSWGDVQCMFDGSIDPLIISTEHLWKCEKKFEWLIARLGTGSDYEDTIINIAECRIRNGNRAVLSVGGGSEEMRKNLFLSFYDRTKRLRWRAQISVDEMVSFKKWQAGSLMLEWDAADRPRFTSVYMKSVDGNDESEVVFNADYKNPLYAHSRHDDASETGFYWNNNLVPIWDEAIKRHGGDDFPVYTIDAHWLSDLLDDTIELETSGYEHPMIE